MKGGRISRCWMLTCSDRICIAVSWNTRVAPRHRSCVLAAGCGARVEVERSSGFLTWLRRIRRLLLRLLRIRATGGASAYRISAETRMPSGDSAGHSDLLNSILYLLEHTVKPNTQVFHRYIRPGINDLTFIFGVGVLNFVFHRFLHGVFRPYLATQTARSLGSPLRLLAAARNRVLPKDVFFRPQQRQLASDRGSPRGNRAV